VPCIRLKVKPRRHETGEQEKQKWSKSLTRPLRHCAADATAVAAHEKQQRQPFHFVGWDGHPAGRITTANGSDDSGHPTPQQPPRQ
jgi:hypothetical protein